MSFPILSGKAIVATGFDVANSCMFNAGDSPYMYKDLGTATAGSGSKFTFSVWVKRGALGTDQYLFSGGVAASNHLVDLCFKDDDTLRYRLIYNNTTYGLLRTDAKFRDTGAWMHIVINMDTTQGTAADRTSMYVNGTKVTSFSTSDRPNQNSTFTVNNNTVNSQRKSIGRSEDSEGDHFDGYMAEVVWIDGSTLAASSFGEFNEDSPNIWQPVDVSGLTFGTHGFYLDFEASDNLGNDANGGTDLTESGLAAIDQKTDTCTNNFATMNPLVKGNTALTFSEANLKLTSGGGWGHAVGNIGVAHGKWYWEIDEITASNNAFFGICNENNIGHLDNDSTPYSEDGLMLWFYDGRRTIDGTDSEGEYSGWGTTHGFALDLDSSPRTIKFYKDGSLEATENLTSNFPAGEFVFPIFMGSASSNTASVEFNFGNPVTALASGNNDANGYGSFEFSPPSGYIAICSKNLGSDGG